jgi:hypothetical protein
MPADRRKLAAVVGLSLGLLLAVGGWQVYRHLFFQHTPAYRASEPLFEAARTRPLTADEFDQALALCDCGERVVEYRMYAAVAVAVGKTPDHKPRAVALFTRLAADPSDPQRQATAAGQLARLTAAP